MCWDAMPGCQGESCKLFSGCQGFLILFAYICVYTDTPLWQFENKSDILCL